MPDPAGEHAVLPKKSQLGYLSQGMIINDSPGPELINHSDKPADMKKCLAHISLTMPGKSISE